MIPTAREKQILVNVCKGYSSKEIGALLFISANTVEAHKRSLMLKMKARNIVHLAVLAERNGLSE